MTISPLWAKVLGAVITAVLGILQLDGPWDEIIKTILDSLVSNPRASGLGAASAYLAGQALWDANQGLPKWQQEAIKHGAGRFSATTGEFEWVDENANAA